MAGWGFLGSRPVAVTSTFNKKGNTMNIWTLGFLAFMVAFIIWGERIDK